MQFRKRSVLTVSSWMLIQFIRAMHAGIDSDIKLWAPTAEEPKLPGRRAERIMAENRQQQVSVPAVPGVAARSDPAQQ